MSRFHKNTRRDFLRGLGAGAALLPILETDFAFGADTPKRVLCVIWTNGVLENLFYPSAPGPLGTFPRCTAPLAEFKDDLIIMSGIDMKNFTAYGDFGAGHESFANTFTGTKGKQVNDGGERRFTGGSISVDQYIATKLAAKGIKTPFSSLDLAVWTEHYWYQSRCFFRGSDNPVNPETDPVKAFNALFAGRPMTGTPGTGTMGADLVAKLAAERKSILDVLKPDLQAFSARMGKSDKERIEGHLDSIRELEKQIGTPTTPPATGGGCTAPKIDALAGGALKNDNYPKAFDQHIDLLVHAFKCDLTRVGTLMTNNGNGLITSLTWLNVPTDVEFGPKNYHGMAHKGGDGKATTDEYFMTKFAALLRKMKAVPEGNGTMLDNTVILWANHMGNGGAHNVNNLPWIIAGKGGGYFKTGRYIRKPGQATNGVLKALCSSMDVDPAGFGDGAFGGEMVELRTA